MYTDSLLMSEVDPIQNDFQLSKHTKHKNGSNRGNFTNTESKVCEVVAKTDPQHIT